MGHRLALGVGVASALFTATIGLTAGQASAIPSILGNGGNVTGAPGLSCSGVTCTNNSDSAYLVSGTVTCKDDASYNFGTVSGRIDAHSTEDLQFQCAGATTPSGDINAMASLAP